MNEKILSIVIISRNDDYMEDQLYRLSTVLCLLAENLAELDQLDKVEAIVVDWGSDVPLRQSLALSRNARRLTRFVTVSQPCISDVSPGTHFHWTLGTNVGLRRAVGTYRMLADSDSIMPSSCLHSLLSLLSGDTPTDIPIEKSYLHIPRYQIPLEISRRHPSLEQWRRYCSVLGSSLEPEGPAAAAGCLGGFAASQLLHEDLWNELSGYDEKLREVWGWSDNDLVFRLSRKYGIVNTSLFGIYSMHMEHGTRADTPSDLGPKTSNAMRINYALRVNGENWGLSDRTDWIPEPPAEDETLLRDVFSDDDFSPIEKTYQSLEELRSFCEATLSGPLISVFGNPVLSRRDFESILIMAGVAKRTLPLSFGWFGPIRLNVLAALLAFSRGVECWFCNIWDEGELNVSSPNNPADMSTCLANASYKGNARILLGDRAESLEIIDREGLGSGVLEMAIVADGCTAPDGAGFLLKLFDQLGNGGCAIVEGPLEEVALDDQEDCLFSQWMSRVQELEVLPFEIKRSPHRQAVDLLLGQRPAARAYHIGLSGHVLILST